MFDDEPTAAALRRIDDWERKLEERAEQASLLSRQAARLSATSRSADGLIEVAVGAEGHLEALHLDEGIRRAPAEQTARRIVETIRAAQADLLRQFDDVTARTIGTEGDTRRALMAGMRARLGNPPDPEEPRE
ncbi:YbaB/EbfC family nucleoid-associated protein [Actinoplanes sp. NPDC049548]|uniref:YbaB/EbfC family nucleoid-associated protein n=1 Tax=Actinoplanes sp. NPDC049548 TaxID=3155152 RepID=UPI00342586F7